LVYDDGDEGALEATLAREAGGRRVYVVTANPREELAAAAAWWPGSYGTGAPSIPASMPVHLRWSSAPGWAPPAVLAREVVGVGPRAFRDLAAAKGWGPPMPTRGCWPGMKRLAAK
jgi:hypothetical protein